MKRLKYVALFVLVCVIGVGGVVVWQVREAGREGSNTALESWVRSQITSIAAATLNPTFEMTAFDYQYPRTVVIDGMALTSIDPGSAQGIAKVMQVHRLTIELAAIPRRGQPIVIEKVILEQPTIRLIAQGDESVRFLGLTDLIRTDATDTPDDATGSDTQEPTTGSINDHFQIRLIELRDASIVYDTRKSGQSPMELEQINVVLGIDESADRVGWYDMALAIDRTPIFDLDAKASINLDTLALDVQPLTLTTTLNEGDRSHLPPQLQQLLADHQVTGELSLRISGLVPLTKPMQGNAQMAVEAKNVHATFEQYRLPIDHLALLATMGDGKLTITDAKALTLGGEVVAVGSMELTADHVVSADVDVRNVELSQTLAGLKQGEAEPIYAGVANADIEFAAPASDWKNKSRGSGQVDVAKGRLVRVPILSEFLDVFTAVANITPILSSGGPTDSLDAIWQFQGDHAQITQLNLRTQAVALTGTGKVGMDGTLDLSINGGPIKKLQQQLGPLGELIGAVTDRISTYRVTGTVDEPKVGVRLGG